MIRKDTVVSSGYILIHVYIYYVYLYAYIYICIYIYMYTSFFIWVPWYRGSPLKPMMPITKFSFYVSRSPPSTKNVFVLELFFSKIFCPHFFFPTSKTKILESSETYEKKSHQNWRKQFIWLRFWWQIFCIRFRYAKIVGKKYSKKESSGKNAFFEHHRFYLLFQLRICCGIMKRNFTLFLPKKIFMTVLRKKSHENFNVFIFS